MKETSNNLGLILLAVFWVIISYALVFEYNDFADNRLFIPGLIVWVIIPIAIYSEIKKKRKK